MPKPKSSKSAPKVLSNAEHANMMSEVFNLDISDKTLNVGIKLDRDVVMSEILAVIEKLESYTEIKKFPDTHWLTNAVLKENKEKAAANKADKTDKADKADKPDKDSRHPIIKTNNSRGCINAFILHTLEQQATKLFEDENENYKKFYNKYDKLSKQLNDDDIDNTYFLIKFLLNHQSSASDPDFQLYNSTKFTDILNTHFKNSDLNKNIQQLIYKCMTKYISLYADHAANGIYCLQSFTSTKTVSKKDGSKETKNVNAAPVKPTSIIGALMLADYSHLLSNISGSSYIHALSHSYDKLQERKQAEAEAKKEAKLSAPTETKATKGKAAKKSYPLLDDSDEDAVADTAADAAATDEDANSDVASEPESEPEPVPSPKAAKKTAKKAAPKATKTKASPVEEEEAPVKSSKSKKVTKTPKSDSDSEISEDTPPPSPVKATRGRKPKQ